MFPLYEVEDGMDYTLNYQGNEVVDVYLKAQGRFRHLNEDEIQYIQAMVDEDWDLLMQKVSR